MLHILAWYWAAMNFSLVGSIRPVLWVRGQSSG